jgi:putative SOS response-associated peptidase YedK
LRFATLYEWGGKHPNPHSAVTVQNHWQLIPAYEPTFKTKLSTINAKSETVFQSALYRDLVVRRRCIVPLSGFFEWKRDGGQKRPFRIHLKDEPIMSVTGIWDTWRQGTQDERSSFSILTTAANSFMSDSVEVSPLVNSAKNNSPKVLEPLGIGAERMRLLFDN